MDIQCECGAFRARLKAFPRNTPGRLTCYCDDCQFYLHHLGRTDLLDANGGTEVVPAYPADVEFIAGQGRLKCTRLAHGRMFRFSTSCCNTPVANARPGLPWAGFSRRVYTVSDALRLDHALGPVRSRIYGKYAQGTPPTGTPDTFDLKAVLTVMPFMLRGLVLAKSRPSPFFADNGVSPVAPPEIVSKS